MKKFLLSFFLLFFCLSLHAETESTIHFSVKGIQGRPKDNIEERLKTAIHHLGEKPNPSTVAQFFRETPKNIQKALQPYGYFKSTVEIKKTDTNTVIFYIKPGPVLKITDFQFQLIGPGKNESLFQTALRTLPLQEGDPINIEKYLQIKKDFLLIAQTLGYIDANFPESQIKINLKNYIATVFLKFDTGNRYYFGNVQFISKNYDQTFLKRFVPFKAGDPYSSNVLTSLQNNLSNSSFFEEVKIDPHPELSVNRHIPITITCTPRHSHDYSIGLGYGTDTGPRATLGWDWRRVNHWGHQLQTAFQFSQKQNEFITKYIIPGKNPVTDNYVISLSAFTLKTPSSVSRAMKLTGSYISSKNKWKKTYSLNALYERNFSSFTGAMNFTSDLIYPSINWQFINADDPIYTKNGYRINFKVLGAFQLLLSDIDFYQVEIDGKYIKSLNDSNRIIFHSSLGYTGIQDISHLPTSLRFLSGGSQSVRAYQYQGLGPGKALTEFGIEYQHTLFEKWYGSIFFDAGNVSESFGKNLKRGIGIGIGRITILGPIQLSIAKPLDKPDNKLNAKTDPYRIVFSMGPDL